MPRSTTPFPSRPRNRRGAVVPLVAVLLPVLLVLLGFAVDVAYMQNTRTELRLATDAAARAASNELTRTDSVPLARAAAIRIAAANEVAGQPLTLNASDIEFGNSSEDAAGRYFFASGVEPFNAVRVTGDRTAASAAGGVSLYFGSLIGRSDFEPTATATASFVSFDICLVLDRSSSMKLDVDDPAAGMSASDPRLCQPPRPTSRWAALDNAVSVFVSLLNASAASEQVSLVTYSSNISGEPWINNCNTPHRTTRAAFVDLALTSDLNLLRSEVTAWSESIFNGNTYIEEGIRTGIRAVTGNGARQSAKKVIIVLTDGHQNIGDARNAARDCADQQIVCHAITFSDDADRALMAEVAAIGGGSHLHADTAEELIEVFRRVAGQVTRITE